MADARQRKRVVFFHPDLGIGGAERLIIDAAVGLQDRGHTVTIFTSHCDPRHCFEEARDGTLDVRVRGHTFFPPSLLNRFHILLAILRQLHLVISVSLYTGELGSLKPDAFVVDQLSACIPVLRWLYPNKQRTLFYCHFPDQLLARRDEGGLLGMIKTAYRLPFDWFEAWSTGGSDRIAVNSNFTKAVAASVFPSLQTDLGVIYPCVDVGISKIPDVQPIEKPLWEGGYKIILSINRFERKKNIGLAVRAFHDLTQVERKSTRLIVAGGYDQRVSENVQYHQELVELAEGFGLITATAKTVPTALAVPGRTEILFLLSVPGPFKSTLLQNASLLVYTPMNEHFGIVPVEAMQYGTPVLASNTGGPLETVVENETGWLRDVTQVEEWTAVLRKVLFTLTSEDRERLSRNGKQRVKEHFTRPTMARRFEEEILKMVDSKRVEFMEWKDIAMTLGLVATLAFALIGTVVARLMRKGGDHRASEFARINRQAAL